MTKPHLLLASQSPRRRELLQLLGMPFGVAVSDVSEAPMHDETPAELVTRLSRAKAKSVRDGQGLGVAPASVLVIACDTVVALEGGHHHARVLGKPSNAQEATAMLRLLRGRSHAVYSAVTVLSSTREAATELARTRLTMRNYTEGELAAYVASGDPLDKAGAYAIQHAGFHPVKAIEGCYASVMGLPLCHLTRCLRHWDCPLTVDVPAACQSHTRRRCTVYADIISP